MGNLLKCRMSATEREYVRRINLVIEYIEENLSQEISLDILAKKAFFSAFHFHRIFSACLGESPADYVRRARLERAANRLIHNHYESMTEIAFSSGFSSSSLFSRLFKQHFGIELSEANKTMVFWPEGIAHGFYALEDCELLYKSTNTFDKALDANVAWNDPAFQIAWPTDSAPVLSARDAAAPMFDAIGFPF